jgi:uncharacterized protein (TIGR02147 family)
MNIYHYINFRDFIKDAFSALRNENENLSIREILRRIGCASPSYFKEVIIDAQKKMSPVMTRKFALFLKLDTRETDYFLALVGYNQAETESERILYYEELLRHKVHTASENKFLELREYEYLSSWELSAIREFLHFHDGFKNLDAEERKKLAGCFLPKISDEQIKNAIQTLESLEFIKKDAHGNYRKTKQNIRSVKKTPAAYRTLCQNMKHALEIINTASPENRIFKNVIVSISSPTYEIIEKKVQEFCKEILDIASNDAYPEDRLYSLGLQFFPLTKLPEDAMK